MEARREQIIDLALKDLEAQVRADVVPAQGPDKLRRLHALVFDVGAQLSTTSLPQKGPQRVQRLRIQALPPLLNNQRWALAQTLEELAAWRPLLEAAAAISPSGPIPADLVARVQRQTIGSSAGWALAAGIGPSELFATYCSQLIERAFRATKKYTLLLNQGRTADLWSENAEEIHVKARSILVDLSRERRAVMKLAAHWD